MKRLINVVPAIEQMLFLLLFTTVNGMSGSESEIFSQRDLCDTDAFRFKKEMTYNINPKTYNDEILVTLISHMVILDKAAFFCKP